MRLSIRYKILAVTGLLLLLAIGSYTWLASFIFTEQKTALLFDINHSIAVNSAAQVRSSLNQVADQLKLFAVSPDSSPARVIFTFPQPPSKTATYWPWAFTKKTATSLKPRNFLSDVPTLALDEALLTPKLLAASQSGMEFWRAKTPEGTSFFYLASRIEINLSGRTDTYLTLAGLDGKPFFEMLHEANLFESFLIKPNGEVLAHLQQQNELAPEAQPGHPLLDAQKKPSTLSGVQSYEYQGSRRYGAFAPVGLAGMLYISQADESEVTSALTVLLQRSLLFGVIVLTLTFIASVLFSKTLTRNLQFLTGGAIAIGEGNLTSHIDVQSGDEVETLARSFTTRWWMP